MTVCNVGVFVFVFKQKTADEWRISDWSSDGCSSDLGGSQFGRRHLVRQTRRRHLERGGEVEDHLAVLAHDDAAVREAAPVEIAVDAEMQRLGLVAAAQEIGVERMDLLAGIDGDRKSTRLNSSH